MIEEYELSGIRNDIESLDNEINNLKDQFRVPDLEKYIRNLHDIEEGFENIDSKQNQLMEKIEDNLKRINSMLLEVKGIASIFRAAVKNANL